MTRTKRSAHGMPSATDAQIDAARKAVQEALDRRDNGGETGHQKSK
jgi:hypothetical protein